MLFSSITAFSKEYKVSRTTVHNRIRSGKVMCMTDQRGKKNYAYCVDVLKFIIQKMT